MSNFEVIIYASGLLACSVCAPKDMDIEEVTRQVNMENPTGISSRWTVADEPFADGAANPHECEQDNTRLHYLFTC